MRDAWVSNDRVRPMLLKNSLAKPITVARWAIFYELRLQMRRAIWVFRSFHPIFHSVGATIPPKSCKGLASLAKRRRF